MHPTSLWILVQGWCSCLSPKRFIFPFCSFSWDRQTHKHIGGLLLGGSVQLKCCVWLLALCLFITIVKGPCLCLPPPLQNPYKNIFVRLSQGSVMPWQQLQHYRLLPASGTISFLHISVAKSPRRPLRQTTLGFQYWLLWTGKLWCEIDH